MCRLLVISFCWFSCDCNDDVYVIAQVLLDCRAVQADALTVDRLASLEKVLI